MGIGKTSVAGSLTGTTDTGRDVSLHRLQLRSSLDPVLERHNLDVGARADP
jgi:hypothetical protein